MGQTRRSMLTHPFVNTVFEVTMFQPPNKNSQRGIIAIDENMSEKETRVMPPYRFEYAFDYASSYCRCDLTIEVIDILDLWQ